MATIGWQDVAHAKDAGSVSYREYSVALRDQDIARWKDDPDGRFKLILSEKAQTAELGTFYPSL